MKLPYFEEPKTDGQLLFNLQHEYKSGRPEALGEMYTKLYTIAFKNINAISQSDRNIKELSSGERKVKAHDAATYIVEQYLKRSDFAIYDSITGYLYKRVQKELYYTRNCDRMLVYTDELPDRATVRKSYEYIVTNEATDKKTIYTSAAEMYLDPTFKGLRKKRLAECINNGTRWKTYKFDLLEVAK